MRWLVVLLAACNQVYDLDPTKIVSAQQCANVRFGPPFALPGLEDFGNYEPQFGPDLLEIWFRRDEGSKHVLYRATRPDLNTPFGTPVKSSLVADASEVEPAMKGDDGTRMMVIDYDNSMRVYEGVRDPGAPTFSKIRAVIGIEDTPGFSGIDSIDLSWDGLTLYYTGKIEGELWVATRESLDAPFTNRRMLLTGIRSASMSPDERELFYTRIDTNVGPTYRRARASKDDAFGDEEIIIENAFDPDVSPNAEDLVVSARGVLSVLTRECR